MIAERARGSLAKQIVRTYRLGEGGEPGKYCIGLEELWQVKSDNHRPGLVRHSCGWPLGARTGASAGMNGEQQRA
jgi:electron-transferring-flavoprotein dehydrogenase